MSTLTSAARSSARLTLTLGLALVISLALVLTGPAGDAHAASRAGKVKKATDIALRQIGDPYRYGAAGPGAFDCSGLLYYSFRKAGVSVPRSSSAQAGAARRIAKSDLRRGDVMFFHRGGDVYHAAIYLGRSGGKVRMLHSPSSGEHVRKASPWTSSWYAASFR